MAQVAAPRDAIHGAVPAKTAQARWWNTALNFVRTYPYLLPAIFFFLGWQLIPIYDALRLSFTDDKFLDQVAPNWIGLQNYRDVLQDGLFWEGLKRAFIFTIIFVPGMIFIPMFAAICLDRVKSNKLSTAYRLILLVPSMIPAPLIFVLWLWMYNNYVGPINYLLVDVLHLFDLRTQPQWLADPRLTFISIAFMEWWWGLGYHTDLFPGRVGDDPTRPLRCRARRWRQRMAHVLGSHDLAVAADHPRSGGDPLRQRDGRHRGIHHHGRLR